MKVKLFLLLLLLFSAVNFLQAQNPYLVIDINTKSQDLLIESSAGLIVYNDRLYFSAIDNAGPYLWSTDGTVTGTLRNVNPGINISWPGKFPFRGIVAGGYLYYCSGAAEYGANQLWKTDGTPGGSQLLGSSNCDHFIVLSDIVYFSGNDEAHGNEIWRSDGTPSGTYLLKDIIAGATSSDPLSSRTVLGDKLIFEITHNLYATDGTSSGTLELLVGAEQKGSIFDDCLVNFQDAAYFIMDNDVIGLSLWKTDGTASGTVLVKDLESTSYSGEATEMVVSGNQLFFVAKTQDFGKELWVSDGTPGGTKMVKDIWTGWQNGLGDEYLNLCPLNGKVYFGSNDGIKGNEPWYSDGTEAGTQRIIDLRPNAPGSDPFNFISLNDKILFNADNGGATNKDLFITDGTASGTELVSGTPFPYLFKNVISFKEKIFFIGGPAGMPAEFWVTDGTDAGTYPIEIDLEQTKSTTINDMVGIGPSNYILSVSNYSTKGEMWFTDGTAAGSVKLYETGTLVAPEIASATLNGTAFFQEYLHDALWKTDGTVQGTVIVKEIDPELSNGTVSFNGLLYFIADDLSNASNVLWRTDGTEGGTYPVGGSNYHSADNLVLHNGQLYFTAYSTGYGTELWTSDGTAAGTMLLKDIDQGSESSYPGDLTSVKGKLYFSAWTSDKGREPWVTDGTSAGTKVLIDIFPGSTGSYPANFNVAGDFVYFSTTNYQFENQLWKTDGTNTILIINGIDGTFASNLSEFIEFNGQLYFVINDNVLASTDYNGTITQSVYNMNGKITNMHVVNNQLYFTVTSVVNNFSVGHLWQSNGTPSGTFQLVFFPAVINESAQILLVDENLMFLALNEEATGAELWKFDAPENTEIQNPASSALLVFPNPSLSGIFQYILPELKDHAILELCDLAGRKLYEEKIGSKNGIINLAAFSKGLYLLIITYQEQRLVSKLIYD